MFQKNPFIYLADEYFRYRPTYPQEWYSYLAGLCEETGLAVDCATGNGQAALGLAEHFKKVFATDSSESQIGNAFKLPNVEYHVSPGEVIDLPDHSVDLITVAQGVHWFDLTSFFAECKRCLKKNGVIALWSYNMTRISKEVDPLIERLAFEILAPFWEPQVQQVFSAYQKLPFPFVEIFGPEFLINREWSLKDLLDYLRTWSAVAKYWREKDSDPIAVIFEDLKQAWGDIDDFHMVRWPLYYRVGKKE